MSSDFEKMFFKALHDRLDKQDERFDKQDAIMQKILTQTQKTNGRVLKLEDVTKSHSSDLNTLKVAKSRRINLPSNVLYLLALGGVITLIIVANFMGINLKGLL